MPQGKVSSTNEVRTPCLEGIIEGRLINFCQLEMCSVMKILKPARSWRGADTLRSILLHWRALPCEAAAGFQVAAEWNEQPHSRDSTQTLFFRFTCTFAMVFIYFYTLQKTPTLCIYFYSDFRSLMIRKVRLRCKNHLVARLCCVCVWSKNNPDAENIGLGREKKTSKKTTKNLQRSEIKKSHNLCGPFFTQVT